jgi:hypothetical protein
MSNRSPAGSAGDLSLRQSLIWPAHLGPKRDVDGSHSLVDLGLQRLPSCILADLLRFRYGFDGACRRCSSPHVRLPPKTTGLLVISTYDHRIHSARSLAPSRLVAHLIEHGDDVAEPELFSRRGEGCQRIELALRDLSAPCLTPRSVE